MTQQPGRPTGGGVNANDLLAFGVEVLALGLLAVWGAHLGGTTVAHVLGGILVPGVAVVLWGLFAAPRARVRSRRSSSQRRCWCWGPPCSWPGPS